MLDATYILQRPLITEKTAWEAGSRNRVSFVVHAKARKPQIKAAVEKLYGVRVESVATQVRKGKFRRTRWGQAKTADWKKAIVHLHADDRIELF